MGNLPTNFGVSSTFCSRLIGQHLSDTWRDLATFTFDLGDHGACRWYVFSCSVCVPRSNFVSLPVQKILGIYCVSINPPGDFDLWSLNPKTVPLLVYPKVIHYTKFEHLGSFVFELCCGQTDRQTNRLTRKSYPPTPTDRVGVGNNIHSNIILCKQSIVPVKDPKRSAIIKQTASTAWSWDTARLKILS